MQDIDYYWTSGALGLRAGFLGGAVIPSRGELFGFVAGARFEYFGRTDGECSDCSAVQIALTAGPTWTMPMSDNSVVAFQLQYDLNSPDLIGHRWGDYRIQPAHLLSISATPMLLFQP